MKKKILVLTSTFPRWKNDSDPPFVYDLSIRLASKYKVFVLAPHAKGTRVSELIDGISVQRFRYAPDMLETLAYNGGIVTNIKRTPTKLLLVAPFIIAELLSAYKLIRKYKIDAIHAHWIIPQGLVAILLKKLVGFPVKILCTAHGADVYTQKSNALTSLKRIVLNQCDAVTAVSDAMNRTIRNMGVTTKVETLPMGTDLATNFVPNLAIQNDKQLIFVGRLVEKKGVKYLLDAFHALLINTQVNYKLLIIGDGPEKRALENQAERLGLTKSVIFSGGIPHDSLAPYLQASSIAVFPFITTDIGDQEGFGLVLVEAMGCQCAVITTNISTVKDAIKDQESGLIVDQQKPQALLKAIDLLINNDELRNKIAKKGREHAEENFDWKTIADRYITLFNKTLEPTN